MKPRNARRSGGREAGAWTGHPVTAELRQYNGAPTIFVNGRPVQASGVAFRSGAYGPPSFRHTGPEIVVLFVDRMCVGGDGSGEIDALRQWFNDVFAQHPNTLGGCVLSLQPSFEWISTNPGEMALYDRSVDWNAARVRDASWASEVWREDSSRFVEELCRHLHGSFAGRVIFYQVGAGHCGENFPIQAPLDDRWFCGDRSEPMLVHFRNSLAKRYRGDEDRLRRAWGRSDVTFETATPPDRLERLRSEWLALRSPHRSQTADYHRAWSEAVEDCVLAWAEAVKRGTNNESLSASPIGAILDAGLNSSMNLHQAKNAFSRAVASPCLDMFQSPASYALRDPGRGDTSAMIPLGMLRLAGKIWLRDFDSRTSVVRKQSEGNPVGSLWRTPETPWEDVQILVRDTAYSLIKGGAFWWHEINDGMYSLPEHADIVKRLHEVGRGVVYAARSVPPGLAVFVDNESNYFQANSNRLIYAMNYEARRLHWTHAGMACEVYHLDDAGNSAMPEHKVLMATNAFCMTDAQAEALVALARRNSAAIIWLMAPGVQTPDGFDLSHTSKFTGFTVRSVDIEALPRVFLEPNDHPWSRPRMADGGDLKSFGAGPHDRDDSGARCVGPLFYADTSKDTDVTVLGILDPIDRVGLAVRQMDGWTSVYCSAPYVHNALLRRIGKDLGAHLYLDTDDLLHAAADLLLIHARRGGKKHVSWPATVETVFDLVAGRELSTGCARLSLDMKEHETRFLFAGPLSRAREVRQGIQRARPKRVCEPR